MDKTPINRENRKKKLVDFSILGKIFNFFRKSYLLVPSHGGKNGEENPVKTVTEGFSGNRRKNMQKIRISRKKKCRKRASGISESVRNSVLKAIPTKHGDLIE